MSADLLEVLTTGEAWIGCEHPERQPDENMSTFPNECDPCEIVTQAAIRLGF